jgi:spore coat polysaccharide biosynthesis predicted glycosyltransferase SpsG
MAFPFYFLLHKMRTTKNTVKYQLMIYDTNFTPQININSNGLKKNCLISQSKTKFLGVNFSILHPIFKKNKKNGIEQRHFGYKCSLSKKGC